MARIGNGHPDSAGLNTPPSAYYDSLCKVFLDAVGDEVSILLGFRPEYPSTVSRPDWMSYKIKRSRVKSCNRFLGLS